MSESQFQHERLHLVDDVLKRSGITNERVLQALRTVPRERFLSETLSQRAYENRPQPIDCGQTISQPLIVGMMTEALQLSPSAKVLEVGTGSGYGAAVLAEVAQDVYTIERHEKLAHQARSHLQQAGYDHVRVRHGDGTLGWPEQAPFDGIVVTAAGPRVPDTLKQQLKEGGHLVIPVGSDSSHQSLLRVTRTGAEEFSETDLGPVRFVPLIGTEAWAD